MMVRKTIMNTLVSAIVFPLLVTVGYWKNIVNGNYQYYDAYFETLGEYLKVLLRSSPYLVIFFLVFVQMPFQLIKDDYHERYCKQ